ncbi:MAG: contractile injection system protein, VgrG/Pvc8 family, partial [Oscillospiraceae bacterium]
MAAKELNNVKAVITIDGKTCDFSMMTLHQTMGSHHRFIINVNYRAKQKSVWEEECRTIFEKLNGKVVITISDNEGIKNIFEGVVQHIDIKGESSNQGEVILTGGSPTLLMIDDFHMDSFSDMGVGDIVHEVIGNLGIEINTKIEPASNKELPFVYRYKESSYGFLRRLTVACGESFYYDGRQLVVGFPKETGETIGLSFKDDL